ncbi:polysaccharide biosynthesis tyrosine autokinase [Vibrio sp. S11_S32]|uniref:polysaccharide biosynthesis tyrosine autokinase n=1 Tax=Vibrio sp. S11_S32 TaxID=2720225 RepID=UPI0016801758|nr:polysaccharide biosynthesis tyrosine autokinase [Vibrio sp. S11_S32]MBD1576529.1 polysaccharide biosynthesis tyrosine autokinase [Vibrio sp. S11_S32]
MSVNSSNKNNSASPRTASNNDVIDLGKLFGILLDHRWFIIVTTFIFAVLGVSYALLATPIYKTDALIQVEQKSTGMPALNSDMTDLFDTESPAATEIEILKSRMVLGETVDNLNLTTVSSAIHFPIVGKGFSRLMGDTQHIKISRFILPENAEPQAYTLTLLNQEQGTYSLSDEEGKEILTGQVGKLAKQGDLLLFVSQIEANDNDSFSIGKISRLDAIQTLQTNLEVSERGKQTGILQLSLTGESREDIKAILNDVSKNYFMQNVERNSAEAESSLKFLKTHLPTIKSQLNTAEDKLNLYRQNNESVDLTMEAQSTLNVMVTLESQLNELTFKESDISKLYTKNHPAYQSLLDKRKTLLAEKARLNKRIEKLPKTQREILRMTRDVQVNQQIYIQLLNKVQELNIVKASTVGNVRIIDGAQSFTQPVKPKKPLIAVLATLLGGMLSVALVLLKTAMHKGIESPEEIEAIGLPVYASIPLSLDQDSFNKKRKQHQKNLTIHKTLLAEANPADLAIEALRSLRTSLYFAMMEAKNKVLMISGPSPSIGKSFISANMATVIAQADQSVLVIDADMRKGKMGSQFNTSDKPGLSDYLSGQMDMDSIINKLDVNNLSFIARGNIPPNPSELLLHPRFKALLDWASEHYDMVIVDTPPILAVTDAAIVGAHAGTTLIVGRFEQNTAKEVDIAKQRFEQNGIEVKGFILNAFEKKAAAGYGGYGYYQYEYKSDKASKNT